MKKIFYGLTAALMLFAATSCVNDLNVESIDPNQSSELDVDGLFSKIYNTLGTTGQKGPDGNGDISGLDEGTSAFYRMMWNLNELPADMVYWIWPDPGYDDLRNVRWNASNSLVKGLYSRLYFDISLCNLFLEQTEDETGDDIATKRAEVRFMRALNYYYLLDMFGNNVPKVVKSISEDNPMPFTAEDRLFDYIESELLEAKDGMAEPFSMKNTYYYRADRAAAWLLLSRLYLGAHVYLKDSGRDFTEYYDYAAVYSDSVINHSGGYKLASEYRNLFMGDNDIRYVGENDAAYEIILPIAQDGLHVRSYGASQFLIAAAAKANLTPDWGMTQQWASFRSREQLVKLFFPELNNYAIEFDTEDAAGITTANASLMSAIEANMPEEIRGSDTLLIKRAGDDRALFVNYSEYGTVLDSLGNVVNGVDGSPARNVFANNVGAPSVIDNFCSGWAITKFTNKYKGSGTPTSTEWADMDVPLMRMAEAYLNYAEAVLRGGTPKTLTALDAVNELRERANAEPLPSLTLDDVLDERGREFYSEGYRRSDLIRFGRFGGNHDYYWELQGGAQLGKSFEEYRNLYPIPSTELILNPNLHQNEGY